MDEQTHAGEVRSDVDHLPADVPANIAYFAYLGLVDKLFQPKSTLDAWDEIFKRPLSE